MDSRLSKTGMARMKIPKADGVMATHPKSAVMASAESSWMIAAREALVLQPWPKMRELSLEPGPPDRSLRAFILSPAAIGLITTWLMTICCRLVNGVPGLALGLCVGLIVLYLGWTQH